MTHAASPRSTKEGAWVPPTAAVSEGRRWGQTLSGRSARAQSTSDLERRTESLDVLMSSARFEANI